MENLQTTPLRYVKILPIFPKSSLSLTGVYDAFNKGLKLASGDIIGFLNADDIFNNNCFTKDCRYI